MNFLNLEYLKTGNSRQLLAYHEIRELKIMELLSFYNPILTGTIPIDIDIESSDLDIICECKYHEDFARDLLQNFGAEKNFKLKNKYHQGLKATIVNFSGLYFEIEIFGQSIPPIEQQSYRHMIMEYKILQNKGEAFKNKIRALKKEGIKTEPAFAKLLGLEGNPYKALMKYELNGEKTAIT